jgi:phosphatidylserine decarboxylase
MTISKGKEIPLEVKRLIQMIYRLLIELTNNKFTSRLLAKFTKSTTSSLLIPSFSKIFNINQHEMEKPLGEYKTLHDLFVRKLKKDVRIIYQDSYSVVSPVDATIEDMGTISSDSTFIVKGKRYSITELLGQDHKAQKYIKGTYMIFYLSPSDYHWIHSPVTGSVVDQWTLGSKSYPVNKYGLKYGKRPLSKNYRVITEVQFNGVSTAIVKVGAMFINSIELLDVGNEWEKGEEIAYFSFGSTVVLLFEDGVFEPVLSINSPYRVKVGECIGFAKSKCKTFVK